MRATPTARDSKTMKRVPTVKDVMSRRFAVVRLETSLREVARILIKKNAAGAAVLDESERFQGFLSTQGLMVALVRVLNEETPPGPIHSYLDPEPSLLGEESSLMAAVEAFLRAGATHLALPVLRGERVVGVVTRLDVIRASIDYFASGGDTGPGTLYLSALKEMSEKPPFED